MPNIQLNKFYDWIQQDDILASSWGIVDSKNITWLRTWYGATLWHYR